MGGEWGAEARMGSRFARRIIRVIEGPDSQLQEIEDLSRVALAFSNASCAHCVRIVTRLLGEQDGIGSIREDAAAGRLMVEFDSTAVSVESICGLMERAGYPTRAIASLTSTPHVVMQGLERVA
jgi:copper chaperone CopZ